MKLLIIILMYTNSPPIAIRLKKYVIELFILKAQEMCNKALYTCPFVFHSASDEEKTR